MSYSLWPHGPYSAWNSPGQNTGVGSHSLHQGIFPTQVLNPGLPHCRRILYQLSHKGSPRILEWVAYPFSTGSFWPRNNWSLLHCRPLLYQLSYQGVPSATKWGTIIAILEGTEERVLFFSPSFLATPCSTQNFAHQGRNPCSLQCKCWVLTTEPSGKSKSAHFYLDYQVRLQPERHYDSLVSVCQAGELGKGTPRQKEQCKQTHESTKQPNRVPGDTRSTYTEALLDLRCQRNPRESLGLWLSIPALDVQKRTLFTFPSVFLLQICWRD